MNTPETKHELERDRWPVTSTPRQLDLDAVTDYAYDGRRAQPKCEYPGGLLADVADWGLEQHARADAAEKVMDDAIALWVSLGHPMLLAAAQELREARAALADALTQQQGQEG